MNGNGNVNDPDVDPTTDGYDLGSDWLFSGTRMSDGLSSGGYLDANTLDGPSDTSIPMGLDTGRFYKMSYNDDDDSVSTVIMDVAASTEMMGTVWGGFHEFRDNRIDEMAGMSYEGECMGDDFDVDRYKAILVAATFLSIFVSCRPVCDSTDTSLLSTFRCRPIDHSQRRSTGTSDDGDTPTTRS